MKLRALGRDWSRTERVREGWVEVHLPREVGPLRLEVELLGRITLFDLELIDLDALHRRAPRSRAEVAVAFGKKRIESLRTLLRQGDRSGAKLLALETATLARNRGFEHTAARFASNAAYAAVTTEQLDEALQIIFEARAETAGMPVEWPRAGLAHQESLLAMARGAPREAERLERDAHAAFRASGDAAGAQMALAHRLLILGRLGRFEEGQRLLDTYPLRAGTSTRARASRLANQSDLALRAWRAGTPLEPFETSMTRLEQARALFLELGDPARARERQVELAWWSSRAGHVERARAWLGDIEETKTLVDNPGLALLTRAQIALLEGRPHATLRHLTKLEGLPRGFDALEGEVEITGALLRGRAEQRLGHALRALEAFKEALESAEALNLAVPLSQHPGASLQRRQPLREEVLSAFVAAGYEAQAFRLDDRMRAGPSRRLQAERWGVFSSTVAEQLRARLDEVLADGCLPPAEATPCQAKGEALLGRLDDLRANSEDRAVERPPKDWTVSQLAARLEPAQEIWVFTGTAARSPRFVVSSEGLTSGPSRPDPALRHVYVVSDAWTTLSKVLKSHRQSIETVSLLPYASWLLRPPRPRRSKERAVVIANPSGDLGFAGREGRQVQTQLSAAAWIGRGLGRDELLEALRGADVLHFAGHGKLLSSNPWTTTLRIGEGETLTLDDWVKDPPALRLAVLNGCSTAGQRPRPGDLGFPQAMLETGTRSVLATTRPVRDGAALRFIGDFLEADGHAHPGRGFRAAVDASQIRRDRAWRAFQLWGDP